LYQQGDTSALAILTERNTGLIRSVANKYTPPPGHTSEDLFQVAWIGLYDAIKTYDASKAAFTTHANYRITAAISHFITCAKRLKRCPEQRDISLNAPVKNAEDLELYEVLADDTTPGQDRVIEKLDRQTLRAELESIMQAELNWRQCQELQLHIGWQDEHPMSFREIASITRCSKQAISARYHRALRKLRESKSIERLRAYL
jgi:RNA polymerase sigma factor (sigma-70 family)